METLETKISDRSAEKCVISFPEAYLESMKLDLMSILKNRDWKTAYKVASELKRQSVDLKNEKIARLAAEYIFRSKDKNPRDWIEMFELDDYLDEIIKSNNSKDESTKNSLLGLSIDDFGVHVRSSNDIARKMKMAVELTFDGILLKEKALTEAELEKSEDILVRAKLMAEAANMDFDKLVQETEKMIIKK